VYMGRERGEWRGFPTNHGKKGEANSHRASILNIPGSSPPKGGGKAESPPPASSSLKGKRGGKIEEGHSLLSAGKRREKKVSNINAFRLKERSFQAKEKREMEGKKRPKLWERRGRRFGRCLDPHPKGGGEKKNTKNIPRQKGGERVRLYKKTKSLLEEEGREACAKMHFPLSVKDSHLGKKGKKGEMAPKWVSNIGTEGKRTRGPLDRTRKRRGQGSC